MLGRQGSTRESILAGAVVGREGATGTTIRLDEVHSDEEISIGNSQVVEGFSGAKVAEVAGKKSDEALKRSSCNAAEIRDADRLAAAAAACAASAGL